MKHTKKYTWNFNRVNSKGKVIFKHLTKESLEDVKDFLDKEGVDYDDCSGATMLRVYYGNSVYQYFYTTGRWAKYNSCMNIPKKHYHSTGVKDFLTRFLRGKNMKHINSNETMDDLFEDTTPSKLHRKGSPRTSIDAAHSVPTARMRRYVLSLIDLAGLKGTTIKEMNKNHPQYTTSTISARPCELERGGHIFYAGDKRDRSRVIRHIKYKNANIS